MTRRLILIIVLAVLWLALTGAPDAANLALGLGLGSLITILVAPSSGRIRHAIRPAAAILLIPSFVWNVLRASVLVAIRVATPRRKLRPAIIAVPLDAGSELQTTLIANMISLTPGTLTLDHDENGEMLFVHVLHVPGGDVDAARSEIRNRIERPLLAALELRRRGVNPSR